MNSPSNKIKTQGKRQSKCMPYFFFVVKAVNFVLVFSLGSLAKLRKSMTDFSLEQESCVDSSTIVLFCLLLFFMVISLTFRLRKQVGSEKSLNAANLYSLLKIRPSYTNLMQRKIIFNFFNDFSEIPGVPPLQVQFALHYVFLYLRLITEV